MQKQGANSKNQLHSYFVNYSYGALHTNTTTQALSNPTISSTFGMVMPGRSISSSSYRYGFQGQEKDDEIKGEGNSLNYTYRMHDPRLGRFFAVDPLAPKYPHNSPYAFSENRVIDGVELEGLEWAPTKDKDGNVTGAIWKGFKTEYNVGGNWQLTPPANLTGVESRTSTTPVDGTVPYVSVINTSTNNVDIYSVQNYSPNTTSIGFDPKFYYGYFETLMDHEGGYNNIKADKGGATNLGITVGTYKRYTSMLLRNNVDIKNIQPAEALAISQKYWAESGMKISDFQVGLLVFDIHFNGGMNDVVNSTLGSLGIGKKGLSGLNSALNVYKAEDIYYILKSERHCRYDRLVLEDPSQKIFYNGWINNRVKSFRYKK